MRGVAAAAAVAAEDECQEDDTAPIAEDDRGASALTAGSALFKYLISPFPPISTRSLQSRFMLMNWTGIWNKETPL